MALYDIDQVKEYAVLVGGCVNVQTTVSPAVTSRPKRKPWLLPLWQTFRQGKNIEH